MQNTKDSFYLALRDRLSALDPSRSVTLNGVTRPAILVAENESATAAVPLPNAFYIHWLGMQAAKGYDNATKPLLEFTCRIDYWTEGTFDNAFQDRGRSLAALDSELLQICAPSRTLLMDHTQTPAVTLNSIIFWSRPVFASPIADGRRLLRSAQLTVFSYAEFVC